jgi:hypothetical protein
VKLKQARNVYECSGEVSDMDAWHAIEEIVRDLLIFVGFMVALLIVLLVTVSLLPSDNPLKRLLTALSFRVGATAAAAAVAVPLEPIPGLDVVYDIGAPLLLLWYWYTFFRDSGHTWSGKPKPQKLEIKGP